MKDHLRPVRLDDPTCRAHSRERAILGLILEIPIKGFQVVQWIQVLLAVSVFWP